MAQTPPPGPLTESDVSDFYSPPAPEPSSAKVANPTGTPRKRKHGLDRQEDTREKRQKTQTPVEQSPWRPPMTADLPCELWQHIFSFLPPRSLPQQLWTCRNFYRYLTDSSLATAVATTPRGRGVLHPDQIWQLSRRRWLSSIPTSSPGVSEPDLFKLLGRTDCQFCGKSLVPPTSPKNVWSLGPGHGGVRRVWPFAVRSCGPCLAQRTQTETSLMFSEYSALLSVVPFVFFTQNHHVLSPFAFRSAGEIPQNVVISKVFFVPQLESAQKQLFYAREKSSSAAMSVLSAMATQKAALLELFEAWERWEMEGGIELLQASDMDHDESVVRQRAYASPAIKHEETSDGRGGSSGRPCFSSCALQKRTTMRRS